MALPSKTALLREISRLDHPDRAALLGRLGAAHAGSSELVSLIQELGAGTSFEAFAALALAGGARDPSCFAMAMRHPSSIVRRAAANGINRCQVDDNDVERSVLGASEDVRRALLRAVRSSTGRTALADRLIPEVRARFGDREAASLLPRCSAATVAQHLPELAFAVRNWSALARRHPQPVLTLVRASLEQPDPFFASHTWSWALNALAAICDSDATRIEETIALLLLRPPDPFPPVLLCRLPRWAAVAPQATARLFGSVGNLARLMADRSAVRATAHMTDEDLLLVLRRLREHQHAVAAVLARRAPSARERLFATTYHDMDTATLVVQPALLDVLPLDARHRHALRMLALSEVKADPDHTLLLQSYLRFESAEVALVAATRRSSADLRAIGYDHLIRGALRSRDADTIERVLDDVLDRLRNEQEPVRLPAASALRQLRVEHLSAAVVAPLSRFVDTVVSARDTSWATRHSMSGLALRTVGLLANQPADPRFGWALAALSSLGGSTNSLSLPPLHHVLRRGAEHALADALLPRMTDLADVERNEYLLSFARALGRRAWGVGEVQRRLGDMALRGREGDARRAADLWLEDPRQRSARVAALIDRDESAILLPRALDHAARHEQRHLKRLLSRKALRGRFASGRTRPIPLIDSPKQRWTPDQCRAYSDVLEELIDGRATSDYEAAAALRCLASVPDEGAIRVGRRLADPPRTTNTFRYEAALAAFSQTDRPADAIRVLLDHFADDHARVAVPSARRCSRFVPPQALREVLVPMLDGAATKLTARKELVRLLADRRVPAAAEVLTAMSARSEELHRDLRIALATTALDHIEQPWAPALLDAVAGHGADEAEALAQRSWATVPLTHRHVVADVLVQLSANDDPVTRGFASRGLARWGAWSDRGRARLRDLVLDLDDRRSWRVAIDALRELWRVDAELAAMSSLVDGLIAAGAAQDRSVAAGEAVDQAARRRLEALVECLVNVAADRGSDAFLRTLRTTAVAMEGHSLLAVERAQITGASLDRVSAAGEAVGALAWIAAADAALAFGQAVANRVGDDPANIDESTAGGAVDALLTDGSMWGELAACRIVDSAGGHTRWTSPWRQRLGLLRQSAEEIVAREALHITLD